MKYEPQKSHFSYENFILTTLLPINETVWKGKFNQEITKDEHHSVS